MDDVLEAEEKQNQTSVATVTPRENTALQQEPWHYRCMVKDQDPN